MNSTGWAVIVIIIIIIGGAWWFMTQQTPAAAPAGQTQTNQNADGADVTPPAATDTQGSSASVDAGATVGVRKTVTVIYNGDSFSPSNITISKGDTVTFENEGGGSMWVASNEHPNHTAYDGSSRSAHCAAGYTGEKPFDQCGNGASFSFTFTKTGSFGYHNHSQAQLGGTVVVK
ncbi:hypothetical protein EXS62_00285 [Candidatus Kaiserbacteria bacterium]|nr:hypothetical protein [Candidatus Kaiserbacteria bacterium]